jgi:pimeloyl-ACP methyl ester carboxylesterase
VKGSGLRPALVGAAAAVALLGAAPLIWQRHAPRSVTVSVGRFPEELVYVRSEDDVVNGGVKFMASQAVAKPIAKPIAVIWIHGWGVNFYSPTYVMIGRALANRGVTGFSVNTRMHDIGNVQQYVAGKRVRGGGYWGIPSEQTRDIGAWIDFAGTLGFPRVVLVGHSAGWAAVRAYEAERQDSRVVGIVLASGQVEPGGGGDDSALVDQAKRLVNDGRGDDLLRLQNSSFPSFISAATFLDDHNTPREVGDFFGLQTANPAVTLVRCPLLAFFGTRGDVGTEADLQALKSSVERQKTGPSSVTVKMITNADHMYTGEEDQVAQVISDWIEARVNR